MEDQDGAPSFWLWPGRVLAAASVWWMNQRWRHFFLSPHLYHSTLQIFLKICFKGRVRWGREGERKGERDCFSFLLLVQSPNGHKDWGGSYHFLQCLYHTQLARHSGFSPLPSALARVPQLHPVHISGFPLKDQFLHQVTEIQFKDKTPKEKTKCSYKHRKHI